jgi:hypothetical protein
LEPVEVYAMQNAKLLCFLTDQGGEYRSERGTLAKELAVAIGVPVQEVHGALRRLEKVGSIERTFALGRTQCIRLLCRESQSTRSEGVRGGRRNWLDTIEDRLGALEFDVSRLREVVERLTGIVLQELERDRWAASSNEGVANSMVALPGIEASRPGAGAEVERCHLGVRRPLAITTADHDEMGAAMSRLADYKLEVFYLPELADDDREELRDRAQAALEEALPGLAERLRDEGLLIVAEDDEAHVLL